MLPILGAKPQVIIPVLVVGYKLRWPQSLCWFQLICQNDSQNSGRQFTEVGQVIRKAVRKGVDDLSDGIDGKAQEKEPRAFLALPGTNPLEKSMCLYLRALWGPGLLDFSGSFICGNSKLQQQLLGNHFKPLFSASEVGVVWTKQPNLFILTWFFSVNSLPSEAVYRLPDICLYRQRKSLTFITHGCGAFWFCMSENERRPERERTCTYAHTCVNIFV